MMAAGPVHEVEVAVSPSPRAGAPAVHAREQDLTVRESTSQDGAVTRRLLAGEFAVVSATS